MKRIVRQVHERTKFEKWWRRARLDYWMDRDKHMDWNGPKKVAWHAWKAALKSNATPHRSGGA